MPISCFLCFIPLNHAEGTYTHEAFHTQIEDSISLYYDDQYQILTYVVPNPEGSREISLYQISDRELLESLKITYAQDGVLQKITVRLDGRDLVLYIHYTDAEHAKETLRQFAVANADAIVAQIRTFTGVAARLFVDYFCDGDAFDFHAVIGTDVELEDVRQKYPNNDDAQNCSGNYPMDYFYEGDNEAFHILVACARDGLFDYFRYTVDLMSEHVREKAVPLLQKTSDFAFICEEYD